MLNKSKFLIKRFIPSSHLKTTFRPPFKYQQFPSLSPLKIPNTFQAHSNYKISSSLFSSFFNWRRNKYKEDIDLLKDFSQKELNSIHKLFDYYASTKDIQTFSSREIRWIVSILQRLSDDSRRKGDINQAYSYLSEAEEICQKRNLKNTIEVANSHFMRANFYLLDDQNLSQVEEHLDEAERICWLFDDNEKIKTFMMHIDLDRAFLYRRRHENDKALDLLNLVLEKVNDKGDRVVAEALSLAFQDMGFIYARTMNYDKTTECLSKGLKIATDHFGEYSQQAFQASKNLFKFYSHFKKNQEALYYAQKNLQIALRIFSKEDLNVAWCYYMLATFYATAGEIDKVLEALEETIKIYEKSPQENPRILSDIYYQASNFCHLQGKCQEASALLVKSNKMLRKANLKNDIEIFEIYLERANGFKLFRRWNEAEDSLRKALKFCQDLPLNKLRVLDIHFSLGEVFYGKEDWKTAFKIFKETEMLLQEYPTESFTLYLLYSYLGSLYIITKDYDKGISYLEKAVECCEKVGDIGFLMLLYSCLGKIYNFKGMSKEKEEAMKKFRKYENVDQTHSNIQAGLQKAFQIFKIIIS